MLKCQKVDDLLDPSTVSHDASNSNSDFGARRVDDAVIAEETGREMAGYEGRSLEPTSKKLIGTGVIILYGIIIDRGYQNVT